MMCAPGFSNPILDSQAVYSTLMSAMSEPAKVFELNKYCDGPQGLYPTTAAIALTLFDNDTKIFHTSSLDDAQDWVRFHCSAPSTQQEHNADYAIVSKASHVLDFSKLAIGTPEYPERSTTLIFEVESLEDGACFEARGPGIENIHLFSVKGIHEECEEVVTNNHGLFLQGLDCILVSSTSILCLPRTTKLRRQ